MGMDNGIGMNSRRGMYQLAALGVGVIISVLAIAGLIAGPAPAFADDAQDAQQLVEKAGLTFQNFAGDPNFDALRDLLKTAKGVYIAPQVLRGAFIIGISGGSGVLLAR